MTDHEVVCVVLPHHAAAHDHIQALVLADGTQVSPDEAIRQIRRGSDRYYVADGAADKAWVCVSATRNGIPYLRAYPHGQPAKAQLDLPVCTVASSQR